MALKIAPRELEREAAIVLRKLAAKGAYLQSVNAGRWGLMSARNKFSRPVAHYDDGFVRAIERNGWVEINPLGNAQLSPGGIAWLRANGQLPKTAERGQPCKQSQAKNLSESPLTWLAGRKSQTGEALLSEQMVEAGERLRRDFETAHMGQRVTAQWGASIMPGARGRSGVSQDGLSANERALAARQRVWRALEHVGPGLSSVLLEVCCLASGLEAAERHLKWPKRSAKLVLTIALQRLAEHYGYAGSTGPQRKQALQMWGASDYRPDLLGHLQAAVEG